MDGRARKDSTPRLSDHDASLDGIAAYWGPNMREAKVNELQLLPASDVSIPSAISESVIGRSARVEPGPFVLDDAAAEVKSEESGGGRVFVPDDIDLINEDVDIREDAAGMSEP